MQDIEPSKVKEHDRVNEIIKSINTPFSLRVIQIIFRITSNILPIMTTKFIIKRFYKPSFVLERRKKKRRNDTVKIPSKEFYITYANYKIHVSQFGDGKKVLMSHGWGSYGLTFKNFIVPFVQSGFQIIIIDFPAHGSSSGTETSMFDFIKTIDVINTRFGPLYAIVGHSVGGLATLNYLSKNQTISKAIILSTPTSIDTILSYYKSLFSLSQKVIDYIKLDISQRYHVSLPEVSIHKIHSKLSTPTLIFHDKNDNQIPYEEGMLIANKLIHSKFISTNGLGHYRILKAKKVIEESIHFLNN